VDIPDIVSFSSSGTISRIVPPALKIKYKKYKKKLDNYIFLSIIITILTISIISNILREGTMATRKSSKKYKTSDICNRFDISRATLFRWESEGLLTGVGRDWRGWRIYSESNVKAIEKIMKGKNAG